MGRNPALVFDFGDIARALQIDGWMDEFELDWLARQAKTKSLIVEVGSYKGRSTRALADNADGVVYAFDDWHGPRERLYVNGEEIYPDFSTLFTEFQLNLADHLTDYKVKIIQGNHGDTSVIPPEFLRGHLEERPDMVFIDGSHDYDQVKRDLLIWRARLRPGGLMCGHDSSWTDVFRAVNEIYPNQWEQVPLTDIWRVIG